MNEIGWFGDRPTDPDHGERYPMVLGIRPGLVV